MGGTGNLACLCVAWAENDFEYRERLSNRNTQAYQPRKYERIETPSRDIPGTGVTHPVAEAAGTGILFR